MNTGKINPKLLIFLIAIFIIGFLLRLNQSLNFHVAFAGDACRDFYMAKEIAIKGTKNIPIPECGGCYFAAGNLLKNSNFYFYFLSVPYFLFKSPIGIPIFNLINGLVFCFFSFLVIRKVSNERIACFSLIIAIFSKFFIVYNTVTFQSYYIATFAAIIIWLSLKNKFWSYVLALILGFISTEIHLATLPLLFFIFYRIIRNFPKYKIIQKLFFLLLSISFLSIFLKINVDFSRFGYIYNSSIKHFSLLNIYNNISNIFTRALYFRGTFLIVLITVILNIKKFKVFYPLIFTLLFTGFMDTVEYSGYYSVYYLLFLFTIGFCIDYIYLNNKYIVIGIFAVFLLKSNPCTFFDQINFYTLKNYKNDWYQQSVIYEINKINPLHLPISAGYHDNLEPIYNYYYYANDYDLESFLKIKNDLSQQKYKEGILMCYDAKDGLCPFVENNKNEKDFTLIRTIEGYPFYYWQRK